MINTTLSSQWTGYYTGVINGDNVQMELIQNENLIKGTMSDSYQNFEISGEVSGNRFAGDAKEKSLGLTFTLLGEKNIDVINFRLLIEYQGQSAETPFSVTKQEQTETNNQSSSSVGFPSGATFPAALIGRWTKHESYNSGYGDNFMGANFNQSLIFNIDGSFIEGGSNATMSGNNYYGQSADNNSKQVSDVKWYAINNQLYLMVNKNGDWQSVMLGTWYTENNHLLITGKDGAKLLLGR